MTRRSGEFTDRFLFGLVDHTDQSSSASARSKKP
jgi:hypothetical protein